MQIHLIAVGHRMPDWVNQGYAEYARRMPAESSLQLVEIPLVKRSKGSDLARLMEQEGEKMLAAIPKDCLVVALEVTGKSWSTEQLADRMSDWMQSGRKIALLVGGPEGLAPACRQRADASWSLSALTLPHPLVRIVVAEQLYRATCILKNHPYHK
ncbi:MAG: 23S rRNA (pseudouridine(1915)-N(3))-methyltransferase RlmH [Gammaproteobacteria bacterium]|nr:23S rRNA (pseudouridine(1915)-N(3))-methyltransferase RlmH [Gammaproteobacteria bacterium]MDH5653670.1 23S rRNA (pseudouridine(1915)-N(3))-methyltransferase RlmH [Gammaproteobacteria bacterium]